MVTRTSRLCLIVLTLVWKDIGAEKLALVQQRTNADLQTYIVQEVVLHQYMSGE